ncbi:MAG TPA: MFS transporter [Rhodocyclaceae bacterium]|nr:MFS transporter [Rhodocyclaceae bacterium]
MTRDERRAGASLAAIFGLRMLGLFLILPVFAVYAPTLAGGDDVLLVGLALGAYGLTQAFFQIPYGMASDRWGRKPVIVAGLLLFAVGSFLAAAADNIYWVIAGRVVQGAGAISAAVTALAADLTREQHRTKVMAMIGSTIGLVFALSLVIAPLLFAALGMPGIFALTGILALAAIVLLLKVVPSPPAVAAKRRVPFSSVLLHGQLARLNFGVLALHVMQTALWVVVPPMLVSAGGLPVAEHWKVYLPAVLISFVVMVPAIIAAEKHGYMKPVFVGAILLLVAVQIGLALTGGSGLYVMGFWLLVFFVGFNILEAIQPSMISRLAPAEAKGAALGIYNTTQSVGLFLGGALGGWLLKHFGASAVQGFCAVIGGIWLLLAAGMTPPVRKTST